MNKSEFEPQFAKLFAHMDKRFNAIEEQLATKAESDELHRRLDEVLARLDDDDAGTGCNHRAARST
ncbi:hypothetical protein [Microbacterium aurum]